MTSPRESLLDGRSALAEDEMPVPILRALEYLNVTLARGCPLNGPYWATPPGGKVEVKWMERAGCYRFTLDLIPPLPFPERQP